jgi:hypothetical protein
MFDVEHKLECYDIEYIIRLIKLYKDIIKVYLLLYEKNIILWSLIFFVLFGK